MGSRAAGRSVACIPQVDGEDWHLEQQGCRYLGVLGLAWVVWVLVRELGVNSKRLSLTKEHKHEAVLPNQPCSPYTNAVGSPLALSTCRLIIKDVSQMDTVRINFMLVLYHGDSYLLLSQSSPYPCCFSGYPPTLSCNNAQASLLSRCQRLRSFQKELHQKIGKFDLCWHQVPEAKK